MNPAFIRKKYDSFQDEANLEKQVGPIYQNIKRMEAIKEAIQNKVNIAILDDGFQDFSINKNLSIICFNEKQWIGNGMLIPSGPLRENLSALKRADCVFINGKKNVDTENEIYSKNKEIKIFYTEHKSQNISEFKNKKVIAFAGIGNPINFFNLLKENNIDVIEEKEFPDHYNYSEKELKNLISSAKEKNAILLDASAYNIQFINSRPIFIDILSIDKYEEGDFWKGHSQFLEHFLNPLFLLF